jgi:hypothetical protein
VGLDRFKPGDMVTAGPLGDVQLLDDIGDPSIWVSTARVVGVLRSRSIGLVVSVVNDKYVTIIVGTSIGVAMSAELKLLARF